MFCDKRPLNAEIFVSSIASRIFNDFIDEPSKQELSSARYGLSCLDFLCESRGHIISEEGKNERRTSDVIACLDRKAIPPLPQSHHRVRARTRMKGLHSCTKANRPPCCVRVTANNVVLGTYALEDGKRVGSVDMYKLVNNELKFCLLRETPAVLDLKVSPIESTMLVLCHSTGDIILWRVCDTLEKIATHKLCDDIITSISFKHDGRHVLATFSSGASVIVNIMSGSQEQLTERHELECWTGAFGSAPNYEHIVFTGGDDSKLIAHDLRTAEKVWAASRHHDAGVTLILPAHPDWSSEPHKLMTGSYDDCVRILDIRNTAKEIYKSNLGGGVWRLQPGSKGILACCMYDGARILDSEAKVHRYFKGHHESICYGGDWSADCVVTCSFYDRVVQVWTATE